MCYSEVFGVGVGVFCSHRSTLPHEDILHVKVGRVVKAEGSVCGVFHECRVTSHFPHKQNAPEVFPVCFLTMCSSFSIGLNPSKHLVTNCLTYILQMSRHTTMAEITC